MVELNLGGTGAPARGADPVKDSSDQTFMQDVIDASRTVPVIVDFWATWCGPCKQLGPALEKVVRAARGKVRLVKVDIDRNQQVAAQLRVQSIPAVYAFYQGRPVDAFNGALPESQLKQFVDRLVQLAAGRGGAGADAGDMIDQALKQAAALLEQGDPASAGRLYAEILQADPGNAAAYAGTVRAALAGGDLKRARQLLERAPVELAGDKELQAARKALELLEESKSVGSVKQLRKRLEAAPEDHQARYDLAMALFAAGQGEETIDQLLDLVRRARTWEEDKARLQLLKVFEALGPADRRTIAGRRKLSSILFA